MHTVQPSDDQTLTPQEFEQLPLAEDNGDKIMVANAELLCQLVLLADQLVWIAVSDLQLAKLWAAQGKNVVFTAFVTRHENLGGDVFTQDTVLGRPIYLLKP